MPQPAFAYRLATTLVRPLIPLGARLRAKLARGAAGRHASAKRFETWGRSTRDPARPLVLIHAASAGELRQVEPVIHRLRSSRPSWQLAVTYFSPSGLSVAVELPVEVHGFLPWDRPREVGRLLTSLRPSALVVSKVELWPELAFQAHGRGVRLALLAATVRPGSGRLRWPARPLLAPAYALVDHAAAVSREDAERLVRLGVPAARITVEGDPRYDAVLERLAGSTLLADREPLLVAGSTGARDEAVLLAAFARVRALCPAARLLLAPHEPTPATRSRLTGRALELGLPPVVPWGGPAAATAPLTLLETVGGLALLYQHGRLAYLGGGFGSAGLHSVLEPAAAGVPVIVGPRWHESGDAARLRDVGALAPLEAADPVGALTLRWLEWLEDEPGCRRAGAAARAMVTAGAGAADRCAALVTRLVETAQGRD